MKAAQNYIRDIKVCLATSPAIVTVEIVSERSTENKGYFRARLHLANGDFLEVSEYFVIQAEEVSTLEYRYQWMNGAQQNLIKRWDNAEHYPDLPNFPHHVHIGDKKRVVPGQSLCIIGLLEIIEREIG